MGAAGPMYPEPWAHQRPQKVLFVGGSVAPGVHTNCISGFPTSTAQISAISDRISGSFGKFSFFLEEHFSDVGGGVGRPGLARAPKGQNRQIHLLSQNDDSTRAWTPDPYLGVGYANDPKKGGQPLFRGDLRALLGTQTFVGL